MSGAENEAERAKKLDERSGERESEKTSRAEWSSERVVAKREQSRERAESAAHGR